MATFGHRAIQTVGQAQLGGLALGHGRGEAVVALGIFRAFMGQPSCQPPAQGFVFGIDLHRLFVTVAELAGVVHDIARRGRRAAVGVVIIVPLFGCAVGEAKRQPLSHLVIPGKGQGLAGDAILFSVRAGVVPAFVVPLGRTKRQPAAIVAEGNKPRSHPARAVFRAAAVFEPARALLGDDVHHPGRGVGAVVDRLRPAQHLDPLDVGGFQTGQDVFAVTTRGLDPVDQDQRVVAFTTPDPDLGRAVAGAVHGNTRHGTQRVLHRQDAALFDLLRGDHGRGPAIACGFDRGQPARNDDRRQRNGVLRVRRCRQGNSGKGRESGRDGLGHICPFPATPQNTGPAWQCKRYRWKGNAPPPALRCHHDGKVRSLERAPRPDKVIGVGRSPDLRVNAWPGLPIQPSCSGQGQ